MNVLAAIRNELFHPQQTTYFASDERGMPPESFQGLLQTFWKAFPDLHHEAVDQRRPPPLWALLVGMLPTRLMPRQRREGKLALGLGLLRRLVQAALCEAAHDEPLDPPRDLPAAARDILVGRPARWHELHPAIGALIEHAVGEDAVEMRVGIQRAAEQLDGGDRRWLHLRRGESEPAGLEPVPGRHAA